MPRAKRTYLVGREIEEFDTEAEAVEHMADRTNSDAVGHIVVYSVTGAQELKPVMRLEKAGSDD
jgi:hypothetical protein